LSFKYIDQEVRGGVGWYRFNRAPRNSINWEMLYEMRGAFEALVARPEAKVIVIASALESYFSTGADITDFHDADAARMMTWVEETQLLAKTIRACAKPVLAAIKGVAVGGGLEMTLHADLRFAADDAQLGQPEINIAFLPPVGGTQALVRLVGRSRAFRILYGGEMMTAQEAFELELVDTLAAPDRLEDEVQAYGEMLAAKPANVLAALRRCLIDGGGISFDDGLAVEMAQARALVGHENFHEGVSAFLDKRKPEWS
jgi:enoyl-CoA hydratase/carnithine racemase